MARKPQHLRGPQPLPEGRVTHGERELLAALPLADPRAGRLGALGLALWASSALVARLGG